MLTSLAAALVAVACATTLIFLAFMWLGLISRRRRPTRADFVVVLGSTLMADGRVPPLLAARLDRARMVVEELRERGGNPVMITSGGQTPRDPVTEASAMADYLISAGVHAEAMVLEDKSRNTEENVRLSAGIMQRTGLTGYRCIIVTSDYHCPRVGILARRNRLSSIVIGARTPVERWVPGVTRDFAALAITCWKPLAFLYVVVTFAAVLAA